MKISIQYIAGFFDGEGSIGLYARKGRYNGFTIKTQLTQNKSKESLYILKFLKTKYGGNMSKQKTLSGSIKYNWQLGINGIKNFLKDIMPYLILKKQQSKLALYWIKNRPKIKRDRCGRVIRFTKNDVAFNNKIVEKMKELKKYKK